MFLLAQFLVRPTFPPSKIIINLLFFFFKSCCTPFLLGHHPSPLFFSPPSKSEICFLVTSVSFLSQFLGPVRKSPFFSSKNVHFVVSPPRPFFGKLSRPAKFCPVGPPLYPVPPRENNLVPTQRLPLLPSLPFLMALRVVFFRLFHFFLQVGEQQGFVRNSASQFRSYAFPLFSQSLGP